jgi:hypothetical protein
MSEKLYSIKEETLNDFGALCRDLTNSEESFNIDGMQDVLGWA